MNIKEIIKDIPLYKKLYKALLEKAITENDLERLPVITKKELIEKFPDNWQTKHLKKIIEKNEYEFMSTSGTTEEKIMLIRPKNWWHSIEQRLYRFIKKEFPNYVNMKKKAILTTAICSNTICYTEVPSYEKRIVNGFLHLNITPDPNKWTKQDIQRIVEEIDKFEPQCFQADPVYLAIFFKLLSKYQINLPKWTPLYLILTYEFCPKKCLNYIKNFWNIPTRIIYGTTEVGFVFIQDEKGNFSWEKDDNILYLQPIENKPNFYELLVTSFRNPYMPLINFKTGDIVYIDPELKKSHISSKIIINQLMGRMKDITHSDDKEIITVGELDNSLNNCNNQILIYQLDFTFDKKIVFKFTTFDDFPLSSEQKHIIKVTLNKLYKFQYEIELKHEKEIHPAQSGKFIIIKKNFLY